MWGLDELDSREDDEDYLDELMHDMFEDDPYNEEQIDINSEIDDIEYSRDEDDVG